MKVVLFCGGFGMRMRDGLSDLPKPMTPVGPRPLIWHVMRYYAHFGHTEFILCLGYGAEHIKNYFLTYDETASNDFTLCSGAIQLHRTDLHGWRITFVHTGFDSPIGERLRRVREHVEHEEYFLANYADVLTDLPLNDMIDNFKASEAVASLVAVPPQAAFHCVQLDDQSHIRGIHPLTEVPIWENGGYFVLRPEIFDYLPPDGDLVMDACRPLAEQGRMLAFRHTGFWQPADTIKEITALEATYRAGHAPWMVWGDRHDGRRPLDSAIAALNVAEVER